MRRLLAFLLRIKLLLAAGNKVTKAAGARRCHCANECWCRCPGLNRLRWVSHGTRTVRYTTWTRLSPTTSEAPV